MKLLRNVKKFDCCYNYIFMLKEEINICLSSSHFIVAERTAFNRMSGVQVPPKTLLILWRNRIARLTSNQKVVGSSPIRITSHISSVGRALDF